MFIWFRLHSEAKALNRVKIKTVERMADEDSLELMLEHAKGTLRRKARRAKKSLEAYVISLLPAQSGGRANVKIVRAEFSKAMQNAGINVPSGLMNRLFDAFDADSSGAVTTANLGEEGLLLLYSYYTLTDCTLTILLLYSHYTDTLLLLY